MLLVPTWVLVINSYDSGIAKTPLFFILAGLLLSIYLAFALINGELVFFKSPADIAVMLFLCAAVISMVVHPRTANGGETINLWFGYAICYFAGTHLFRNEQDFLRLVKALIVVGAVVSVFAIVQYFVPNSSLLDFYLGEGRRIGSTLGNPIYLSGFIVGFLPLLLSYLFLESNRFVRVLLFIFLCLLLLLLLATQSRGSIIAVAISTLLFLFLSRAIERTHRFGIAFVLVCATIVSFFFFPQVSQRFASLLDLDKGSTLARRVVFWNAGVDAIASSPLVGYGVGSYEEAMREFRPADYWIVKSEDIVPHAHNEFLEVGVELGLIGLALYFTAVGVVIIGGIDIWRKSKSEGKRNIPIIGLLCGVAGVLIDNLANVSLRQAPIGALFWLSMGLIVSPLFLSSSPEKAILRIPKFTAVLPLVVWGIAVFFVGRLELKKINSDNHLIRGVLAKTQGNGNDAIAEFNASVQSYPGNLKALENLSVALLQAGRAEEAVMTIQKLQRLSPDYPKSSLIESLALVSMKQYPEAGDAIEKEISRRDHPEAYYVQALIKNGLNYREGELRSVTMALRRNIAGGITYNLSSICERLVELSIMGEEREAAKTLLEELRSCFPNEGSIIEARKKLIKQQGNYEPSGP
ncbi:MAG TPA: O-antigen ligase family protein [Bacteroidota bacterium]